MLQNPPISSQIDFFTHAVWLVPEAIDTGILLVYRTVLDKTDTSYLISMSGIVTLRCKHQLSFICSNNEDTNCRLIAVHPKP